MTPDSGLQEYLQACHAAEVKTVTDRDAMRRRIHTDPVASAVSKIVKRAMTSSDDAIEVLVDATVGIMAIVDLAAGQGWADAVAELRVVAASRPGGGDEFEAAADHLELKRRITIDGQGAVAGG